MLPVLTLGPLAVQVPPLILVIGVWVALSMLEQNAARLKLEVGRISNLALMGLGAAVVGARVGHVLRFPQAYAADPLGILSLDPGALEPVAGFALGILATSLYAARRGLLRRRTLDAFAPVLPILYLVMAAAGLASGDSVGEAAHLPWSIYLWGDYRHPVALYQVAAGLFVLGGWWSFRKETGRGLAFLVTTALLAACALLIERYRADSPLLIGGWRTAQVLSLAILALCLALARRWQLPADRAARPAPSSK